MSYMYKPKEYLAKRNAEAAVARCNLHNKGPVYVKKLITETVSGQPVFAYIPSFVTTSADMHNYIISQGFASVLEPPAIAFETNVVAFISTCHIAPSTAKAMDSGNFLENFWTSTAGYGYMVAVKDPEVAMTHNLPPELISIFAFMRERNINYVVFDRDCDEVPGLEKFEW